MRAPHIAVIGGGFSGTALTIHLVQRACSAADLTIIEPRTTLGCGLAYSTSDPAHRVNVPAALMSVFPDLPLHFESWLRDSGVMDTDPGMIAPRGLFPVRSAFGTYVAECLRGASGGLVTVRHAMDMAHSITPHDEGWLIGLGGGGKPIDADLVVLATGHPPPAVPSIVQAALLDAHQLVVDPWAGGTLSNIGIEDHVIILGTGLTMADVVASLELLGHHGRITAISRHGLLPRDQAVMEISTWGDFAACPPMSALNLLQQVRGAVREANEAGLSWHSVVQSVQRGGQAIWATLSLTERRRVLRHLRAYWDVHRFRVAPQVSSAIRRGLACGKLEVLAGSLTRVSGSKRRILIELKPRGASPVVQLRREADIIVIATGPAHGRMIPGNPVLASAALQGLLCPDPLGLGIEVDAFSRSLDATGLPNHNLLVVGPPARGTFGELVGVPEVVRQAAMVAMQIACWLALGATGR